jgi:hypothetical protein
MLAGAALRARLATVRRRSPSRHRLLWKIGMTRPSRTDWEGNFILSSQVWTTRATLRGWGSST